MASLLGSTHSSVVLSSLHSRRERNRVYFSPVAQPCSLGIAPTSLPSISTPHPRPLALPGILCPCQVGLFHHGHWAWERVPGFMWSLLLLLGIDAALRAESKSPIGNTRGRCSGSGGGFWLNAHPSGILGCKVHEGKTDYSYQILSTLNYPLWQDAFKKYLSNEWVNPWESSLQARFLLFLWRDISEPVSLRFSGSELVGKKIRMGLCMASCVSLQ